MVIYNWYVPDNILSKYNKQKMGPQKKQANLLAL